ncbi:MAG: zinc-binding dehydrogenase [Acidimicrobiales bacterium]
MQAVVLRNRELIVDDIAEPTPTEGQVLAKVLACGICGSDLHAAKHIDRMAAQGIGNPSPKRGRIDPSRDLVMGHEYCLEIVDLGPGSEHLSAAGTPLQVGDRVCSLPMSTARGIFQAVGYSNDMNGGYAERMAVDARMCLPVGTDVPTELAALTEPLAVGEHAVAKARLEPDSVPLVVGCGPVGLAVIVALRARGVGPIIASDFSPTRRALAAHLGADVVIDPGSESPYDTWATMCWPKGVDRHDPFNGFAGITAKPNVIFECVGVPGMIARVAEGAQRGTRIVVVGVCMEADQFEPFVGINKELEFQFVLGYTGEEFATTLAKISTASLPGIDALITGSVDLSGTPQAFTDLADPEQHVKILVRP